MHCKAMRFWRAITFLALLFSLLGVASAATTTKVRLFLDADQARPGETVMAGVELRMAPKTHTYWVNPGDSGGPTEIKWMLPPGITNDWPLWPVPEKLNTEGIITYVYNDEVVLMVPLTIASNAPNGKVELKA